MKEWSLGFSRQLLTQNSLYETEYNYLNFEKIVYTRYGLAHMKAMVTLVPIMRTPMIIFVYLTNKTFKLVFLFVYDYLYKFCQNINNFYRKLLCSSKFNYNTSSMSRSN